MEFKKKYREFRNYSKKWWVLLVGLLIVYRFFRMKNSKNEIKAEYRYKHLEPFIIAQYKHETANGTSHIFLSNNNAFGMKQPKSRFTNSLGEKNGYASYASVYESVLDHSYWLDMYPQFLKIKTIEDYVSLLKLKGYFEDTEMNYLNAMKQWIRQV